MSKFCYKAEGILYLNAVKYFDHEYLNIHKNLHQNRLQFFAHSILQQLNIDSHIKMVMRKTTTSNLTADMPTQNFEAVHQFIASNEVFNFMNSIKDAPAYWKKYLHNVLAVVKQLGLPSFFNIILCKI